MVRAVENGLLCHGQVRVGIGTKRVACIGVAVKEREAGRSNINPDPMTGFKHVAGGT